jgi:hypothetical protein
LNNNLNKEKAFLKILRKAICILKMVIVTKDKDKCNILVLKNQIGIKDVRHKLKLTSILIIKDTNN